MSDKVKYWINLADDDIAVAGILSKEKKYLQASFFCHLTIEKALKALVANNTSEHPFKTHNLTKLAEQGNVFDDLSESQLNFLEELNPLNIEARYPSYKAGLASILNAEKTAKLLSETEDFLCWIKKRLEK